MVTPSIIEAVKKKEEGSFKVLYEKCIPYVFTVTKRHVSNDSNIPDIIQEIFARVFLSISSYDPSKGDFTPWLRRLVVNQCYQFYRQEKSTMLHVTLDNASEVIDDDIDLNALSKDEIEDLLNEMPDGYKQVFLLIVIEEFKHEEVGELLGISPSASRSQFSRAKKWVLRNIPGTLKSIAYGL